MMSGLSNVALDTCVMQKLGLIIACFVVLVYFTGSCVIQGYELR